MGSILLNIIRGRSSRYKNLRLLFYVTGKFFYDQYVCYRFGVQKKRFAKNSGLREPRNLLFSYALTVTKRQFGGFYCSYVTVNAVLNKKFFGSQSSKLFIFSDSLNIMYNSNFGLKNLPGHFIDIGR